MIIQSHNITHYKHIQAHRIKLESHGYKRHVIRIDAQTNKELSKLKSEKGESDRSIISRLITKAYQNWRKTYFTLDISKWLQVLGAEADWLKTWQSLKTNERFWIAHISSDTHHKYKFLSLSIGRLDETHWACYIAHQTVIDQDCPPHYWDGMCFEIRPDGMLIFDAADEINVLEFNAFCRYSRFLSYCLKKHQNLDEHPENYPLLRGFVGLEQTPKHY